MDFFVRNQNYLNNNYNEMNVMKNVVANFEPT